MKCLCFYLFWGGHSNVIVCCGNWKTTCRTWFFLFTMCYRQKTPVIGLVEKILMGWAILLVPKILLWILSCILKIFFKRLELTSHTGYLPVSSSFVPHDVQSCFDFLADTNLSCGRKDMFNNYQLCSTILPANYRRCVNSLICFNTDKTSRSCSSFKISPTRKM